MEFTGIALLVVLAAFSGIIARIFRQPLLVGYLFAGVIAALTGLVTDAHEIEGLSKIGVALLLFLVGLEMNVKELPQLGKVALFTGIGQIVFTSTIGYLIALLIGFGPIASIYIAVALTFSSTIIIIKLLSERNDLNTLYGKISVGFLLVQDFVAVILLMMLAGLGQGDSISLLDFLFIFGKAIALFVGTIFVSRKIIPFVFEHFFSKNMELLFVVCLAWALGLATIAGGPLGLSLEIGGFLAGLALSGLPEHLQIGSKMRPLRDFFLTIFFILLGTQLVVGDIQSVIVPALIFSAFVLIGNPIIVLIIMGVMGYRKKTSFFAGLTVAQISEFSLILMAMGSSVGHLGQKEVATVILVAIITMTGSTYFIIWADKLYKQLSGVLSIFERKKDNKVSFGTGDEQLEDHIVLVGADRTGGALIPLLKKKSDNNLIVVDFNPAVISSLKKKGIKAIYGDITDLEIIGALNLPKAKLIISTIGRPVDNMYIQAELNKRRSKATEIFIAKSVKEARKYYKLGVDYVIVPQNIASEHIRHLIKHHGIESNKYYKLGTSHQKRLSKIN